MVVAQQPQSHLQAYPGFTVLGSLSKPHPGSACPAHREPSGTRAPGGGTGKRAERSGD